VADDAPVEALFQARDIFEMIMAAGKNKFKMPTIFLSPEEDNFIRSLFADNGIEDRISFYSLLECADLLMNSSAAVLFFQARRLFQIMLKTL
jgi:hypothetical protein